jgi:hypothetical protein
MGDLLMLKLSRALVGIAVLALALVVVTSSAFAQQPKKPAQQCGGFVGITCGAGQFCQFKPYTCGVADMFGQCTRRPTACIRIFQPVCGCNGKTYPNDCERQRAGTSLRAPGKCPA